LVVKLKYFQVVELVDLTSNVCDWMAGTLFSFLHDEKNKTTVMINKPIFFIRLTNFSMMQK